VYVVMPCHNSVQTVTRAIESVARQSLPPRGLVAVDDASSDATPDSVVEVGGTYGLETTLVRLPRNAGPATARNVGWEAVPASADYVAFLDADDWWHDDKVARQVDWMQQHAEIGWSAHQVGWQDDEMRLAENTPGMRASPLTRNRVLARNPVATPSVMIRRDVPCRFRDGWRHCEDVMAWLDLLDQGYRGVLLHAVWGFLGRRPTSPGGLTGELEAMHAGEREVIETLQSEHRLTRAEAMLWMLFHEAKYRWRRVRSRLQR
jgi:glycosyltransferase involved in cell wall biosynthesis